MFLSSKFGTKRPLVVSSIDCSITLFELRCDEDVKKKILELSLVTLVDENDVNCPYNENASSSRLSIKRTLDIGYQSYKSSPYPEVDRKVEELVFPGIIRQCLYNMDNLEIVHYDIRKGFAKIDLDQFKNLSSWTICIDYRQLQGKNFSKNIILA